MRGIVNLLIIILITYTLNTVPINNTMLSFDLVKSWENLQINNAEDKNSSNIDFPIIKLLSETQNQFINPSVLTIEFSATSELTMDQMNYLTEHISLTLFDHEKQKTLALDILELSKHKWLGQLSEISNEWIYKIELDMSNENLNTFAGNYNLTLNLTDNLWQMDEKLDIEFSCIPDFTYIPAITKVHKDKIYTQVYYLNASKEFLVPVTKTLNSSSEFIRTTLSKLSYETPKDPQIFAQDVKIPHLKKVYLNKGILSCYLNSFAIANFDTGSPENKLITLSLVKTLTDISYVDNIVFYVNKNQNGTFINNLPLKTIYNEDYSTYAYLNYYNNKGQSFLVPQAIDDGQDTVEDLIDILQTKYQKIENGGFILATLPKNITLISKKQQGNILSLTFSDQLISTYVDMPDKQAMMMDSLIQTLTSLPSVDKLIIQTESKASGNIGNITLGTPISANRFLNPISQ